MGFGSAVTTCLSRYASFSGRGRRSEFWWFYLFVVLVGGVALTLDLVLGLGFLYPLTVLALLLPILAAGTRRLHDTGRSGWWWLISIVPFGGIALLVFWVMDSDSSPNSYGPPPKGFAPQHG